MQLVLTMKRTQNMKNLDIINKPLPIYKNMDNSMNNLLLRGKVTTNKNTNINTNNHVYGMLNNLRNNNQCSSC